MITVESRPPNKRLEFPSSEGIEAVSDPSAVADFFGRSDSRKRARASIVPCRRSRSDQKLAARP